MLSAACVVDFVLLDHSEKKAKIGRRRRVFLHIHVLFYKDPQALFFDHWSSGDCVINKVNLVNTEASQQVNVYVCACACECMSSL